MNIDYEIAFLQNNKNLIVAMLLFQIIVPCVIQNLWRPGRVEPLRSREETKKETFPTVWEDSGSVFKLRSQDPLDKLTFTPKT